MSKELIKRLRNAANACADWDADNNMPSFLDWAALMDEAADALEAYEEDDE